MKRREFIAFLVTTLGCPLPVSAQARMPHIGVLGSGSAAAYEERLTQIKQALGERGSSRAIRSQSSIAGRKVSLTNYPAWRRTL
jgi:hypothetical protein